MRLSDDQIGLLLDWFVSSSATRKRDIANRRKAHSQNTAWLQPAVLTNMSDNDLVARFSQYYRSGGGRQTIVQIYRDRILQNVSRLRSTLLHLLDDGHPVAQRIDDVKNGSHRIQGFGRAIATSILMDHDISRYCLWNSKIDSGFAVIGRSPHQPGDSIGTAYTGVIREFNALISLRPNLSLDFEDIDLFLHTISAEDEGEQAVARIVSTAEEPEQAHAEDPDGRWWIEKTYVKGTPSRLKGEYALGRALWTPRQSKAGTDIYRFMRDVKAGDVVLHITDNQAFTGFSFAAGEYEESDQSYGPAQPSRGSYVVKLRDYTPLDPALPKSLLFASPYEQRLVGLVDAGIRNLFYEHKRTLRLHQGAYLTPAPAQLVEILDDAYRTVAGVSISAMVAQKAPLGLRDQDSADGSLSCDFDAKGFTVTGLYFDERALRDLVRRITTALRTGKHVILIGPPGTGKSKLAKQICSFYRGSEINYVMTTATSDWSSYETIGGYRPLQDGSLKFHPGLFLRCFQDVDGRPANRWLIIDELNRADIDKAFGSLFSALTGDNITLPFEVAGRPARIVGGPRDAVEVQPGDFVIHPDWRIIATINTYDKSSLYEMSYAFMRRLAFIPVDVPTAITDQLVEQYVSVWRLDVETGVCSNMANLWKIINSYREIGPSIIEDMCRCVKDTDPPDYGSAVIMYVLPQFEGLPEQQAISFVRAIMALEFIDNKDELARFAAGFFGIDLGRFQS